MWRGSLGVFLTTLFYFTQYFSHFCFKQYSYYYRLSSLSFVLCNHKTWLSYKCVDYKCECWLLVDFVYKVFSFISCSDCALLGQSQSSSFPSLGWQVFTWCWLRVVALLTSRSPASSRAVITLSLKAVGITVSMVYAALSFPGLLFSFPQNLFVSLIISEIQAIFAKQLKFYSYST